MAQSTISTGTQHKTYWRAASPKLTIIVKVAQTPSPTMTHELHLKPSYLHASNQAFVGTSSTMSPCTRKAMDID
ncbi:hypothetical protein E4U55_007755 [Claviceps digitariae]|nr:hypothetical protein E4U55_007755 [Claviceps digitariae]